MPKIELYAVNGVPLAEPKLIAEGGTFETMTGKHTFEEVLEKVLEKQWKGIYLEKE